MKGEEPLGNVLEFYGGNENKMLTKAEVERLAMVDAIDQKTEFRKLNRHFKEGYVVFNTPKTANIDGEMPEPTSTSSVK